MAAGWDVYVVATPAARAWVDTYEVRRVTGFPVLVDYRAPDQPKRAPEQDAVAVRPATFNTVNKWAAGVADNHATGVLCESLGMSIPKQARGPSLPARARR
jgi:phosphopantothenoylcysteine synthetase/decarboxylase